MDWLGRRRCEKEKEVSYCQTEGGPEKIQKAEQ